MYNVSYNRELPTMRMCDLPYSRFAKVVEASSAQHDHVVMKMYDGFVSLNDPTFTWSKGCTIEVMPLPVGSVITLS